jgi:hypothetical protein
MNKKGNESAKLDDARRRAPEYDESGIIYEAVL